ncbi:MAG: transporter [Cytophagales bacterium]|nr:transporter [Cytophagales bacterium]
MIRLYILLVFLFIGISDLYGQFSETIRTDRPGQSIGAFAVGKGFFQIQSGVDYFNYNDPTISRNGVLSNTVFRYGLSEPFEVSAMIEYREENTSNSIDSQNENGFSAVDLGMRYNIYTGSGLFPSIGFQIRLRLPHTGGDFDIDQLAPNFLLVTSQQLSNRFSFTTNWGASWNGYSAVPQGNYTANLAYAITPKLGVFIENYGSLVQSDFDTFLDGGIGYLLNNNLQLDVYSGFGKNDDTKDFFVSAGISWRIK